VYCGRSRRLLRADSTWWCLELDVLSAEVVRAESAARTTPDTVTREDSRAEAAEWT
jgi:hypothetical protein